LVEPHDFNFGGTILDVPFGNGSFAFPSLAGFESRQLTKHHSLLVFDQPTPRLDVGDVFVPSREVVQQVSDGLDPQFRQSLFVERVNANVVGEGVGEVHELIIPGLSPLRLLALFLLVGYE
jgi:hypothetical protein